LAPVPSLLIRDAHLVPLEPAPAAAPAAPGPAGGGPVDVLVEDGRVTEVGPRLRRPDGVEEVAAEGRWLMPGLWDQHTHLGQWTLNRERLDLSEARSPEDCLRLLADVLGEDDGDAPVVGFGHRPGGWYRRASTVELDEVVGDRVVVLIAGDAHHAWVSSAGMRALGIEWRDGVVAENDWFPAYARLDELVGSEGTSPAAYRRSLEAAASLGVVGVVDFEFSGGAEEWCARWEAGCDLLRVRMATYADGLDAVIGAGLRTGDPLGRDPLLTMGPLKIISDGSLNTRTAWCCEPYADAERVQHAHGAPNQSGAELVALLTRARDHGLEVSTHAIGDAAVTGALDAYEISRARGSIEHAQLVLRDDVSRIARLGLRASVQPAHLLDDRDLTELVWPGQAERCFAFRWMLDAGARLVLGSDAPVSPLDPWLAMGAAVHRSADLREPWHPEQALTTLEALAASTDGQGTVAVGSRGDLALLDADPLEFEPDSAASNGHLRGTSVALTVVDGRVTHRAL
jgi:predicted amidohydrolase YtcJ